MTAEEDASLLVDLSSEANRERVNVCAVSVAAQPRRRLSPDPDGKSKRQQQALRSKSPSLGDQRFTLNAAKMTKTAGPNGAYVRICGRRYAEAAVAYIKVEKLNGRIRELISA